MAYAVVGGKKSSTVVGKYNSKKKLIQSTANGGVGHRQLDLEKELKKKEGGKHGRDAFWVCVGAMVGSAYPAIGQMGKYWELGGVHTTHGKLLVR